MSEQNTPLRRSKRGQPVVSLSSPSASASSNAIPTGLLHTRTSQPHDLFEEENPELAPLHSYRTHFYQSFTRRADGLPTRAPTRTYGKVSRPRRSDADSPTAVFNVGDTVLVKTSPRTPSVAVIVAVWKVEGDDLPPKPFLRVRVHWFVRPSELPKFRVQKDFVQNEVLYNISACATLPSSAIIAPCTVSSASSAALTPEKAKSYDPATHDTLFCRLAVNPMRGLYYEHHWESFRDIVMHLLPVPVSTLSEEQLFQSAPSNIPWPNDDVWTVKPAPEPSASARRRMRDIDTDEGEDEKRSPRKRRRLAKDIPYALGDTGAHIDHDEDDADDSADEFQAPLADDDDDDDEDEEELVREVVDDEEEDEEDESVSIIEPRTPSRKRKRVVPNTPRTPRTPRVPRVPRTPRAPRTPRRPRADKASLAQPTPHSKAALRRRKRTALAVRPPPPAEGTLELALARGLEGDAWLKAMHVLHVAARPGALPCRELEYGRVLRAVEELLEEGSGGCIYISGVPGTGKTATVHAVVRELKRMAEQNEANPFAYVEINGLKIPEPAASYGLLWEAVCGHDAAKDGHMKVSSKEALRNLSKHFSSGAERVGPAGGHACVVLMDELDQLMTTNQDVVYNFFNWPTLASSKLVVLAVANTMDLPERVMSGRVRSRLGMVRINFQPYTTPQLEQIVKARLLAAKSQLHSPAREPEPDVITPDALKFAAMKVSSISGDARRVLDICRRAVELVHPRKRTARTEDVKAVIKEMQNSPTAAYLRELGFHERLMLAALCKCVKKEGVEEIRWADVQHQHIVYLNLLANDAEGDPSRRPSSDELTLVLDALLGSHALICEDGAAVARKPQGERRVALNLEYAEVERVLGEVGGPRWRNALNV